MQLVTIIQKNTRLLSINNKPCSLCHSVMFAFLHTICIQMISLATFTVQLRKVFITIHKGGFRKISLTILKKDFVTQKTQLTFSRFVLQNQTYFYSWVIEILRNTRTIFSFHFKNLLIDQWKFPRNVLFPSWYHMLIKAAFQQTSHIRIHICQKLSINLGEAKQPKLINCLRRNIKTTVNCSHMHDDFIFFWKRNAVQKIELDPFSNLEVQLTMQVEMTLLEKHSQLEPEIWLMLTNNLTYLSNLIRLPTLWPYCSRTCQIKFPGISWCVCLLF